MIHMLFSTVNFTSIGNKASSAILLAISLGLFSLPLRALDESTDSNQQLGEQRVLYQAALGALRARQYQQFQTWRQRLHGYPLNIYLDYFYYNQRLTQVEETDIREFLDRNRDSYLADKLRHRWLLSLAQRGRWAQFLAYYEPPLQSTALGCKALEARLQTGDLTALDDVAGLWNVEHSQPEECDEVFSSWIAAGRLDSDLAWQRFRKAMAAGNRTLGNYLTRYLAGREAELAQLQVEIGRYPHRIARHARFQEQSPEMQAIILYGIQRYAQQDPVAAFKVWSRYDAQQLFEEQQRRETQQQLAIQLLRRGHQSEMQQLIADIPQISSKALTEAVIVDALKQQAWDRVHDYITRLSPTDQQEERWLYWRARALDNLQTSDPVYKSAKEIYTQLAMQRDFYAFLAADKLGRKYHLGDTPTRVDPDTLLSISSNPSVLRARELIANGDTLNANREWFYMSNRLRSEQEHLAAAKLAHQWGWHNKTIASLATARSWDDLQMRFPLAYNEQLLAAAQEHAVSPLLLYAIARQESAFAEQARSPAGALGLMQLMPATARQTAQRAGIQLQQPQELLTADKNIKLGSFYLTELLTRYDGNRILATAAYNAGPNRVDRWLRNSASQLPIDIWIESIPFRETRRYVQNVLAYSVIYGYRTGTVPSMLSDAESVRKL